jgi:alkanesulfonate monooxygenase SsuD/methylene tetrahydromethanopterin reductase-like flavin-dependent oxidoreductase (luciferase family)
MYEEFDALDLDFADRFKRLDEHVAVLRSAWQGVSEWKGPHYHHAAAGFHPVPDPAVPIIIGGKGPGVFKRVARIGDGFALPGPTMGEGTAEELRTSLDALRRACDDVGRDYDELLLVGNAPLGAPRSHLDLLAEAGLHMVDLMLGDASQLDLAEAERFMADVAPHYA